MCQIFSSYNSTSIQDTGPYSHALLLLRRSIEENYELLSHKSSGKDQKGLHDSRGLSFYMITPHGSSPLDLGERSCFRKVGALCSTSKLVCMCLRIRQLDPLKHK